MQETFSLRFPSIKKISVTTAFQFFQVARYLGLILASVFLTKSGLLSTEIGVYETIILMSSALSYFWLNGLLTTFIKKAADKKSRVKLIYQVLYIFIIVLFIFFLSFYFFIPSITTFFSLENKYYSMFIYFFLFNSITFFTEYLLLAEEKKGLLMVLGLFHLIFQTAFIAIPAYKFHAIDEVIMGLIAFSTLKFIFMMLILSRHKFSVPDIEMIKKIVGSASVLSLSFFLGGAAIYADGIIVNYFFDKSVFAVYQYGAKEFPISLLMANALSTAIVLQISKNTLNGIAELKHESGKLMHLLFPISILLMLTSKYIFPIVFTEQFSESAVYFNIYLLLVIPRLVFPQTFMLAKGYQKFILYVSAFEFLVNIIASLILLHFFGLKGVAFGTVIAYCFEKVVYILRMKKEGFAISQYLQTNYFIFYSLLLILAYSISMWL